MDKSTINEPRTGVEMQQSNLQQNINTIPQKAQEPVVNKNEMRRSRKSPERYNNIENSHVNAPGHKYVNKGISQGNTDLDNSILQPLNVSNI
jgi:autotransporter adhesin